MTSPVGVPMNSGGLLISAIVVPVPGVNVIGPHEAAWVHLDPGDCRPRTIFKAGKIVQVDPQMFVLHKTSADYPELVMPGAGPTGGDEATAEYWANDPKHSGAHGVSGHDGRAACLADLRYVEAYHGNQSNLLSVGWETKEYANGRVHDAAMQTTVRVTLVGTEALGIQQQAPRGYSGQPLRRMVDGGKSLVGIFGHRDVTTDRGRWDPGDVLFAMLRDRGVEMFDFDAGEDIKVWKERQEDLNRHGYGLVVDGIPGKRTTAALLSEGYRSGIYALGKA